MIVRYAAVGDSFYRIRWTGVGARSFEPVRRVPAAVRKALSEVGGRREAFFDTRTRTARRAEFWELSS
jgi:hypothetical protein